MPVTCITGAKGFIGRHLARHLAADGHQVVGVGHGAWAEAEARDDGVAQWVNGDVSEANLSALAARTGPFDTLFHLAGGSSVAPSFAQPYEDFERTVSTTARLLDWLYRHSPQTRLVVVSTAAVYGAGHDDPVDERAELRPASPYGVHKLVMERLVAEHGRSFGINAAIVRPFSVYGPGLEKQLLFDLCGRCDRAEPGTSIPIGGTGSERRDWLHVGDAVRLLALAGREASPSCPVVNGGTGEGTTVSEIARTVCELWGKQQAPAFSGETRPGDPHSLVAAIDRARAIGFAPGVTVAEGLGEYVEWYRRRAGAA